MKYCPFCGTSLLDEMIFCPKCGKKYKEADGVALNCRERSLSDGKRGQSEPSIVEKVEVEAHSKAKAEKKSARTIIFGIVSIFLALGMWLCIAKKEKPLSLEEIYQLTFPSTVEVNAKSKTATSIGTGFFDDEHGTIITNYHVIDGMTSAVIICADGKEYEVEGVIGYSEELDIAILSTSCLQSVPLVKRTEDVITGENVYALGSSLGLTGTFSQGIVSSSSRMIDGMEYIQITAPISHGNSGGPLLDSEGKVVGITSAGFVDGQNINLAIPIGVLEAVDKTKNISLEELYDINNPYEELVQYLIDNGEEARIGEFETIYYTNIEVEQNVTFEIAYIEHSTIRETGLSFRMDIYEDVMRSEFFFTEITIYPELDICDIYACQNIGFGNGDSFKGAEASVIKMEVHQMFNEIPFSIIINDPEINRDDFGVLSQVATRRTIELFGEWLAENDVQCDLIDFGFSLS